MTTGAKETRYDMEIPALMSVEHEYTMNAVSWRKLFGTDANVHYAIAVGSRSHFEPNTAEFVTNKDGTFGFTREFTKHVIADTDLLFVDSVMGRWGGVYLGMYAERCHVPPQDIGLYLVSIRRTAVKKSTTRRNAE